MVALSRFALVAAAIASANAALSITYPGGADKWWVAKSVNIMAWTCAEAPVQSYTILIANKDIKILTAPIAIVAIANNADCSRTITQDQVTQPVGGGYTLLLADTLNQTKVYATSQEFEIKALGSAYPASTAIVTAASTAGASGTASGAAASATGKSSAENLAASVGLVGAALVACVFGVVAA